jgi:Ca2+-binding EF-hand superfamily protein
MKLATRIAAVALTAAMASPAFAQRGPQRTPEEMEAAFTKADANKDGKLTPAEFKTTIPAEMAANIDDERLAMVFGRRDADKDGFLSKAEFTTPMQRPAQ